MYVWFARSRRSVRLPGVARQGLRAGNGIARGHEASGHDPWGTWQGYVVGTASRVAQMVQRVPQASALLATPADAPQRSTPLASGEVGEEFLLALRGYGFSDEQAVRAYRLFVAFVFATLLVESAAGRDRFSAEYEIALVTLVERIETSCRGDSARRRFHGRPGRDDRARSLKGSP